MKLFINLKKVKLLNLLAFIFLISLLFQIVDGLFPIISMLLFKGIVILKNIHFKFIMILSLVIAWITSNSRIRGDLIKLFLIILIYLILETIYFNFYFNNSLDVIFLGFNKMYFYVFIIPFMLVMNDLVSEEIIINVLFLLFFLSSILGVSQNYLNNSIVPLESLDGYFQVQVYNFYNTIRAFSFFKVSLGFSFFCSFMSLIFIQILHKNKYLYSFFFLVSVYCVYISYSRSGYLIFIFSLINYWIMYRKNNFKLLYKLPFIYFLLGFFISWSLLFLGKGFEKRSVLYWENLTYETENKLVFMLKERNFKNLEIYRYKDFKKDKELMLNFKKNEKIKNSYVLSKDSLIMRTFSWKEYSKIMLEDIKLLLIGTGIYGDSNVNVFSKFCLDNFYLEIIFHIGLIGFVLIVIFLYKIWDSLIRYNKESILSKSNIAIFPTLFLSGFWSYILPIYLSYFCLIFFVKNKNENSY